jgi:hypothetical protein
MKRLCFGIVLIVAAVVWVGCGPSDGKKPASMEQIGAQLEQQSVPSTAEASPGAAASASGVAPPAAGASAAQAGAAPAAVDPSLSVKRGFDLEDWSNEAAYVLVKADAAKAAEALARVWRGKVIKDVFGKPASETANQFALFQLAGHPWSIFAFDASQLEELTPALSRDADVLVFWNSDFNGWAGVELYRGGAEVEAVHWGGVDEKLGEDANASLWHTEGIVTRTYEGISMDDSYLFRSKLRKVTPADLGKGDAFIDEFLIHHDAYLPDAEQMPWFDYDTKLISSPLGMGAFAGVHAVEVAP